MAVTPFPQWTWRSPGLCNSIIWSMTRQLTYAAGFFYRKVSVWLQRHLASHGKPLHLFTALRATSCVCDLPRCVDVTHSVSAAATLSLKCHIRYDLSCRVDVTYLVNAATRLFIVIVSSSGNTSYTIRVICYLSKVHSCRRGQPQKLIRRVHYGVHYNLPFAKWISTPYSFRTVLTFSFHLRPVFHFPVFPIIFYIHVIYMHAACSVYTRPLHYWS